MEERQSNSKTEKMYLRKRNNDSGKKDRENRLKKEKERQRKQKTGRIDENSWGNDTGIQKQIKWTEEKERTTAGTEDREN